MTFGITVKLKITFVEKETCDKDETDSPHPALHKTESVTDLQEEIEVVSAKHSTDEQYVTNDQERLKFSHMKAPMKVDSAPVATKEKTVPPHPTESDRIRAKQSPSNVSFRKGTNISL